MEGQRIQQRLVTIIGREDIRKIEIGEGSIWQIGNQPVGKENCHIFIGWCLRGKGGDEVLVICTSKNAGLHSSRTGGGLILLGSTQTMFHVLQFIKKTRLKEYKENQKKKRKWERELKTHKKAFPVGEYVHFLIHHWESAQCFGQDQQKDLPNSRAWQIVEFFALPLNEGNPPFVNFFPGSLDQPVAKSRGSQGVTVKVVGNRDVFGQYILVGEIAVDEAISEFRVVVARLSPRYLPIDVTFIDDRQENLQLTTFEWSAVVLAHLQDVEAGVIAGQGVAINLSSDEESVYVVQLTGKIEYNISMLKRRKITLSHFVHGRSE